MSRIVDLCKKTTQSVHVCISITEILSISHNETPKKATPAHQSSPYSSRLLKFISKTVTCTLLSRCNVQTSQHPYTVLVTCGISASPFYAGKSSPLCRLAIAGTLLESRGVVVKTGQYNCLKYSIKPDCNSAREHIHSPNSLHVLLHYNFITATITRLIRIESS